MTHLPNKYGPDTTLPTQQSYVRGAYVALAVLGPPLVYAAIKEVVREAENMQFIEVLQKITKRKFRTVDTLYSSEDQLEGARAFAEKRDPVWKGK